MEKEEKPDMTDLKILNVLQRDCRMTTKEIAHEVHLSTTPVFERIKKLEREGYIKKYAAVLDANKLNRGFAVYCNIKMKHINIATVQKFTEAVLDWDEVSECYNVSGEYDFLLKVQATDMKQYQKFVINVIGTLDFVDSIQSVFVMDSIKTDYGIPMTHLE